MAEIARPRISACLITFNEERHIAECIASLTWCDEILVVDSHSTDRTREIAAQLGARVVENGWPGFVGQKQFATDAAANDWVLQLDADERVSPELREEISALRDAGFSGATCWEMPRRTWYLGSWIRHGTWYPDLVRRLYNRRHGRWAGNEPHAQFVPTTSTSRLRNDLLHYSYRNLSDHLCRIDSYTTIMARRLHQQGRRAHLSDLLLHPLIGFVKFYWIKAGFRDGWRGLLLAYLHAHYVRMKYAKLLVLQRETATDDPIG